MKICGTLDNYIKQLKIYLNIFSILGLNTKTITIEQKLSYIYFLKGLLKCDYKLELIYEIYKTYNKKKEKEEKKVTNKNNKSSKKEKLRKKIIEDIELFVNKTKKQIININLEQINNIFILKFILENFELDDNTRQKIENKIRELENIENSENQNSRPGANLKI